MSQPAYESFVFEQVSFEALTGTAQFEYSFDGTRRFTERVAFAPAASAYNHAVFTRALRLAWLLAGVSYYKCFTVASVTIRDDQFTNEEADLLNQVYTNGLSQYVFENNLDPKNLATFVGAVAAEPAISYSQQGNLVLQSGGKDSLLLATLLERSQVSFTPWYVTNSEHYPSVLDTLGAPLRTVRRYIDTIALQNAANDGGLNGHVPVTFITLTYAILDAILHGENKILAAIGREGEEPHAMIGDFAVTHQWSKTWQAEQLLHGYIQKTISPDIYVGSPLRGFAEVRIAELFAEVAWQRYGGNFSSCNVANYQVGHDNSTLSWCGHCPKCANSFLLFAPFVPSSELTAIFHGNLFEVPSLTDTFKGLLGIDQMMKPFECVGEVDELRYAYHQAITRGYAPLPFDVPESSFDKDARTAAQEWAVAMIQ